MRSRRGLTPQVLVTVCLLLATSSACKKTVPPPLEQESLTHLLVDLHLERARIDMGLSRSSGYVDSLLLVHQVSREQFEDAMAYYANRPDEFVALLDGVIDRLRVTRPYADMEADKPIYQRPFGHLLKDSLDESMP